ncbi:MAG: DHA2 family efflux MFS transporter permease subunit [Bacteroidetes bacterium]|nr:DHA2 family efflux MFS transporter permease subunit [Bacteroidota bacterium]
MAEQGFRKWIIVITVITAAIIELIDVSIVNVALTDLSGNLGATIEDTAWVITAYAIANVIVIPMTSFLSSLFGRRNYYTGSIILFTLASFFCGHATGLWELVAFRFLQGAGGGALLSTSQAILFDTFSVEERPLAAGIFSLGIVIGPTIGPTLGGWIIDNHSWPWIFYVNVPIGILAAILSYTFVKEAKDRKKVTTIDWFGIALLAIGVASLQYVLERGEAKDWFSDSSITVLAVVAGIGLIGFVWRQLTCKHPIIDLTVLTRSRMLAVSGIMTFILGFGLFSSVFVVPVFAQTLLGYNAMQTGLLLLPGAATAAVLLPLVGRIMQKGVRPQPMIAVGFLLTAIYSWMLASSTLNTGASDFLVPLVIRGVGLALISVPLTSLSLYGLVGRDMAQGASLNNMMRQLGGAFGIAIVNTFVLQRMAFHRSTLISHITPFDPVVQQRVNAIAGGLMARGSSMVAAKQQAYAAINGAVVRQTMLLSYNDAFLLVSIFFVACVPLVFLLRRKKQAAAAIAAGAPPKPNAADADADVEAVAAH